MGAGVAGPDRDGADAVRRTRVVLTRHGETVWHAGNRYAGRTEVDLTDAGRAQAESLVAWSRRERPDAILSSPLGRAIETARPSAAALGRDLVIVDELTEVDFGIAEGRTIGELRQSHPDVVERFRRDPVVHHFPGAEKPETAARRGAEALRRAAAGHAGATILVVAHNTLLRLALCQLLDIPIPRYRAVFPRLDNAALTELSMPDDGTGPVSLISLNVPPDRC
jgi:2,3-bisphosphoglycerate-dependent phosphoglycerate mutase